MQDREGYTTAVLRAPVRPEPAGRVDRLLGHKGEPWISDIRARLQGDDFDLFALAFHGDQPVANVWVGASNQCPELGVLGHVYTMPEHRRRGLAARLLSAVTTRFDELGGRWLQLHTGNPVARRLYEAAGFRLVLADDPGDEGGNWLMLRRAEGGLGDAYRETVGELAVEDYARRHYAGLCVFLNAVRGQGKLSLLGIDTGMDAEEKLLEAALAQVRGEARLAVLVDSANGRPHAFACRRGDDLDLYAPRLSESQSAPLLDHLRER